MPESTAGWSNLDGQARKFHYFLDNRRGTEALCNRWMIFDAHELEEDGDETVYDCALCRRKLNRLKGETGA